LFVTRTYKAPTQSKLRAQRGSSFKEAFLKKAPFKGASIKGTFAHARTLFFSIALIFVSLIGAYDPLLGRAEEGNDIISKAPDTHQQDELLRSKLPEFSQAPADTLSNDESDPADAAQGESKRLTQKQPGRRKSLSSLNMALKAYREKRVSEAIIGLEQAAKEKSFIARFLLAHIYRTGKGGVVNHRRAYDYYRQIAAEFADADIQYSRHAPYVAHAFVQLARYTEAGVDDLEIKADPVLARILFEKAAHFGDVEGQYQLGRFLIETGNGRNVKLGQRWLTRAAKKNNAKAQAYLGALYWQGDVVARKQGLALAWIEFARRNATGPVKHQVERLFQAVRYDMTLQQRSQAKRYIAQLRTKYHVLWREEPIRPEEKDRELLDGIILAEPPQGLEQDQREAKGPSNQHQEHNGTPAYMYDRYVADQDLNESKDTQENPSSFGYQMFNYGDMGAR